MATVNYTCPNCAAPLKFNPDKQMFSCEYCMSDFTEKYVQDFFAKKEQKENSAEKQEKKEQEKAKENAAKQAQSNDSAQAENKTEEEAVIYNCPSCGAQVVTTASTAATTCFYCQNPVVLGGRLSGEFKPDRVIPFKLSKQKAIDKFLEMLTNSRVCIFRIGMLTNSVAHRWLQRAKRFVRGLSEMTVTRKQRFLSSTEQAI